MDFGTKLTTTRSANTFASHVFEIGPRKHTMLS
jgi:hypothetical protein